MPEGGHFVCEAFHGTQPHLLAAAIRVCIAIVRSDSAKCATTPATAAAPNGPKGEPQVTRRFAVSIGKRQRVQVIAQGAWFGTHRCGAGLAQGQTTHRAKTLAFAECCTQFDNAAFSFVKHYGINGWVIVEYFCPCHCRVLAATRDVPGVATLAQLEGKLQEVR